ncbi:hypothetical protein R0K04_21145, partial [Pseudoalteromonas sp. SIMBA_153]
AISGARKEVLAINGRYQKTGWSSVVGSSGTIKAVRNVLVSKGWADEQERITYKGVKKLEKLLIKIGNIDDIELEGVNPFAVIQASSFFISLLLGRLSLDIFTPAR